MFDCLWNHSACSPRFHRNIDTNTKYTSNTGPTRNKLLTRRVTELGLRPRRCARERSRQLVACSWQRRPWGNTGYRGKFSPRELLHNREADRWRTAVRTKPMLRSYLCVRSYDLRYQEYHEHPDWQVKLARWRLRTGIYCLAEAKGR